MQSVVRRPLASGVTFLALVASVTAAGCTRPEPIANAPIPSAAISASATTEGTAPAAPTVASSVRLVGRFDTTDPNAIRFAWSGSMISARFKGTGITARLHDDGKNVFQVIVDGEAKAVFKSEHSRDSYRLADGLPDGPHEVAIYKRTEAEVGEVVFSGFDVKGEMLPPPPHAERRMELIGDSITAGYGNEGPGAVCSFSPEDQNQYTTYGAVAARALGAEHVTIAWSGKTIGQMTDFYERTLPSRPDSRWDFKSWTPQLVVMNIGTNNFATYDPGETKYVRIYSALYDRVRKAYPDAFIVCLLGPMLSDVYPIGKNNLTLARRYMKAAMAKIKASGETKYEYLELPEQKHSDGLGCGFHPSVKTHKLMADRLTALAKDKLGW